MMNKKSLCAFCKTGEETEDICGKLHIEIIDGKKQLAAHHKCMQYSAGLVQYKFDHFGGFKITKVEQELRRGRSLKCALCKGDKQRRGKWTMATAGCAIDSCRKTYHFYCAKKSNKVITKRMAVRYHKDETGIIMYRVFCSKEHEHLFRNDKKYSLKARLLAEGSDSEDDSSGEETNSNEENEDNNSWGNETNQTNSTYCNSSNDNDASSEMSDDDHCKIFTQDTLGENTQSGDNNWSDENDVEADSVQYDDDIENDVGGDNFHTDDDKENDTAAAVVYSDVNRSEDSTSEEDAIQGNATVKIEYSDDDSYTEDLFDKQLSQQAAKSPIKKSTNDDEKGVHLQLSTDSSDSGTSRKRSYSSVLPRYRNSSASNSSEFKGSPCRKMRKVSENLKRVAHCQTDTCRKVVVRAEINPTIPHTSGDIDQSKNNFSQRQECIVPELFRWDQKTSMSVKLNARVGNEFNTICSWLKTETSGIFHFAEFPDKAHAKIFSNTYKNICLNKLHALKSSIPQTDSSSAHVTWVTALDREIVNIKPFLKKFLDTFCSKCDDAEFSQTFYAFIDLSLYEYLRISTSDFNTKVKNPFKLEVMSVRNPEFHPISIIILKLSATSPSQHQESTVLTPLQHQEVTATSPSQHQEITPVLSTGSSIDRGHEVIKEMTIEHKRPKIQRTSCVQQSPQLRRKKKE